MKSRSIQSVVKRSAYAITAYLMASLPLIFFLVSYKNERDHLSFLAHLSAEKISRYVFVNGSLWEYQGKRLEELVKLDEDHQMKHVQTVYSADGKLVFGDPKASHWSMLEQEAPIKLLNTPVGRLTIRSDLSPLIRNTGIIALFAAIAGLLAHAAIRFGPLRFINQTLERLDDEQEKTSTALSKLKEAKCGLADRTTQLIEAQKIGKMGDWSLDVGADSVFLSSTARDMLMLNDQGPVVKLDILENSMSKEDGLRMGKLVAEAIRRRGISTTDIDFNLRDGSSIRLSITCSQVRDNKGWVEKLSGTLQDISERRETEKQLESLAYFDPLTGLANRTMFKREIAEISNRLKNGEALSGAILLLDLDRFKEVNDTLGHSAGDQLLCKISQQISKILHGRHFFSRLGGDEFALIIQDDGNPDIIDAYAEQVLDAFSHPFSIGKSQISIGTSIGISSFPKDGSDHDTLVTHSDLALYRAKELGRGQYIHFASEMSEIAVRKMALAHDLREATRKGDELEAWLQPQVDIKTNRIVGFEALMRWKHPELGFIPPAEFIPIAESSSLICDIGNWILCESVRTAKRWIDEGKEPYEISVNVSAAQIWQGSIEKEIAAILQETGLSPHLLCIELTESLFVDHAKESVHKTLNNLKTLGVTLALDDFGTGYSSLGYLIQLPFDKLKVDRIFVADAHKSPKMEHVLRGVIALGKGLGMTIVAEGVEKMEELTLLQQLDCDIVQGYLFAKPAPSEQIVETTKASITQISRAA